MSKVTQPAKVGAGICKSPKPIVFLPNQPSRGKPFLASLLYCLEELGAVLNLSSVKTTEEDFSGDAVVKNPPASAGDTGSSPGPGRSHMLQSN